MKIKRIILITLVGLVIIGGVLTMLFILHKSNNPKPDAENTDNPSDAKEFDLTYYQWEIENFPSDKNVGTVLHSTSAIEKAKVLILEKYGTVDAKEFEAEYDSKEECWHIYSVVNPDRLGGVGHAIIRQNGEVVSIWMED